MKALTLDDTRGKAWMNMDTTTNHAQEDARRVAIVEYCRYVAFVTDLSGCAGDGAGDGDTLTSVCLASSEKRFLLRTTAHIPHSRCERRSRLGTGDLGE